MTRPPSLALRLTVLFGLLAAIVFAIFGWMIDRSIEHHFRLEDTAELNVITRAVSQALTTRGFTSDANALGERFNDILLGHHGAMLYVTNEKGNTLFASAGGSGLAAITCAAGDNCEIGRVHIWSDEHGSYRVLTSSVNRQTSKDGHPYNFTVAVAIDYHLHFLVAFRRTLWLMVFSGIAVTGMMGYVAVRQGHAPLRNIIAQIHHISASKLNTRLSTESR
jgi:two-component system heavy metal sensor histidine kinase CusS